MYVHKTARRCGKYTRSPPVVVFTSAVYHVTGASPPSPALGPLLGPAGLRGRHQGLVKGLPLLVRQLAQTRREELRVTLPGGVEGVSER